MTPRRTGPERVRRWSRAGPLALVIVLAGCGGGGTDPGAVAAHVTVLPDAALAVGLGTTVQFTVVIRDERDRILSNAFVVWRSSDRDIASVDPNSGLATAVSPGVVEIRATSGTITGVATLEVYVDPNVGPYTPAEIVFGRNEYTEYHAGSIPVIIAAPHGGEKTPSEIPDRTFGVTGNDLNTQELARAVAAAVTQRLGEPPHLVVSRLRRIKLDPNREIREAAQGNPFAEWSWTEYHDFIQDAANAINGDHGVGVFLDLHGHGHAIQRLELGYLLSASDLALDDAALNQPALINKSSVRTLVTQFSRDFVELIRGPTSLGTSLEQLGYPAVPSSAQPNPGSDPYFTGGFSTARHGSQDGSTVSGIQIEANFTGVRDDATNREAFATALAEAIDDFLTIHLGVPAPIAAGTRGRSPPR